MYLIEDKVFCFILLSLHPPSKYWSHQQVPKPVLWNTIGKIVIWFTPQISGEELSCGKVIKQVGGKSVSLPLFPQLHVLPSLSVSILHVSAMAHSASRLGVAWRWRDFPSVVGVQAGIRAPTPASWLSKVSCFPFPDRLAGRLPTFQRDELPLAAVRAQ